jgi:ATP-dependent exoDNAse (exonuclease V) beta subunit
MPKTSNPPRLPNLLIRASAGTGKTHQLANRFLQLLFTGVAADHILAATFTRKAAGEILDRIVFRLAQAAADANKRAELATAIAARSLTPQRCRTVLRGLIGSVHNLRVGTLDSFFVKACSNFALECGLPPGWQITDETTEARLKDEAIQSLLAQERIDELALLLSWLERGNPHRSAISRIRDVVEELDELSREADPTAWRAIPAAAPLDGPTLAGKLREFERISNFPNQTFARAHSKSLEQLRAGNWLEFLTAGVAAKVLAGESQFARAQIPSQWGDAYQPLVNHARSVIIEKVARQTEATGKLLERFHLSLDRLKRERKALRFDDVTRALAGTFDRDRIHETFFRLDSAIDHVLLDEFQDTSSDQWRAIRPYADRAARESRGSFFCVGDAKQAIYGWRGGVAEILDALAVEIPKLKHDRLTQSRRSSQPVIDTVNTVFGSLAASCVLSDYPTVVRTWADRFQPHTTAKTELPGYCELAVAPAIPDSSPVAAKESALTHAGGLVARLHGRAPERSIGVLMRSNEAAESMLTWLRIEHGIEASGEGGSTLVDSASVLAVRALLKLADHPGDRVAAFHVARSPLGPMLGFSDHADALVANQVAADVRRRLVVDGYGPTLYDWSRRLATACDQREWRRLVQLVELGYRYDATATLRATDFVTYIDSARIEDPTASPVRVMTIHKAKGLEFDAVVLAELAAGLTSRKRPAVVVERPRPLDPPSRVCRYIDSELRVALGDEIRRLFEIDIAREVNESLCVLYVAMTRAKHALYMMVPPPASNEKTVPKTYAGLLRTTLAAGVSAAPGAVLYQHGEPNWYEHGRADRELPLKRAPQPLVVNLKAAPRRTRNRPRIRPSQLEGGARVNVASLLQLESRPAVDRGTLWHAWLEAIAWIDEGVPDDAFFREAAVRSGIGSLDFAAELAQFRQALAQPEVFENLSRAGYRDPARRGFPQGVFCQPGDNQLHLSVFRERSFAVRDGEELLVGTIDRLVTVRSRDGELLGAEIVDFKTDAASPTELDARVEHYRPQIDAYRRAVAAMYRLAPTVVLARLVFLVPGRARIVAPK